MTTDDQTIDVVNDVPETWHHGLVARWWAEFHEHEEHRIVLPAFFAQEVLLMLVTVGFTDVSIQGRYTGVPATSDDATVVFVARRPN